MDVSLISDSGQRSTTALRQSPAHRRPEAPLRAREAFAAAHVVPLAHGDNSPGRPAEIDWDATLAFRAHLWSWGLGVADAMDTAQRNMGLDWAATQELIRRSAADARASGGALVVGVNTDHADTPSLTLREIVDAYLHQAEVAHHAGAGIVLMASRHLARTARTADDYLAVYDSVLSQLTEPVILHWLGEVFDPQLAGYFGAHDYDGAARTVLEIVERHRGKVRGIKMSLLDASAERDLRSRLPEDVRMLTGDDYHYVDLIAGGDGHSSDALLGAFAAIAPAASAALQRLDADDEAGYRKVLVPTEELSRHIFSTPTSNYKTGIAFLAWLNGHQPAFQMVGGMHASRSLPHLSRIVELANACEALEDPELAASRWHALLDLNGLRA
ncbi:MAG: dihydrodipicolinate synthase family protein [Demequina sp.]